MGGNRANGSPKERLKWTKELHDLFEKCVNQIGGPDRATPKGILRAMAIPGLTIFHVKSHLQKYRMSVFTREEDHTKAKLEKSVSEMLPNFGALAGVQLNEALLIQMEAQRRLSDQLEVQRSFKMKIEAQGRFLDKIMEEFKNRSPETKPIKPFSPVLSLPSLSEESDQDFESDFEDVETSELTSKHDIRAPKRIKINDSILPQIQNLPSLYPDSQNLNVLYGINGADGYSDRETGDPWSIVLPPIYNPWNQ